MNLEISRADGTAVVTVTGDMDVNTAYDVYVACVREAGAGGSTVVLDLNAVAFIDSVGLSMLVRARDELANDHAARFILRRPSATVARILSLTALQESFVTEG